VLHKLDEQLERLLAQAADEENRDHALARELQDALLAKLVSGAPMPVRVSSLFWLQSPAVGCCRHPNCCAPSCRGSRFALHGDDAQLIFKHNKTEYEKGETVATFPANSPVGRGLAGHLKWGRAALRARGEHPWSFWVHPESGRSWRDEAGFTKYVNSAVQKATNVEKTTVRGWRTIAATELSSLPGLSSETKEGLARGMGTSVRQWERTYAPGMRELQIKSAVVTATEQLARLRAQHRQEEALLERELELSDSSDSSVVLVSRKRRR